MKLFVMQNIDGRVDSLSDLNKIYDVVHYKVVKLLKIKNYGEYAFLLLIKY